MATTTTTTTTTKEIPDQSALSNLISASSSSSSSTYLGGAKSKEASSSSSSSSDSLSVEVLHNLQHQHNWVDLKLHTINLNVTPSANVNVNDNINTTNDPAAAVGGGGGGGLGIVNVVPSLSSTSGASTTSDSSKPVNTTNYAITLISGLPPRHSYIHPDLQNHLVKQKVEETSLPVQREFVLPLSLNETWTLSRFCGVFDQLPDRQWILVPPPPPPPPSGNSSGSNAANTRTNTTTTTRQSRSTRTNTNGTSPGRSRAYEHRDQKRVLLGMRAKTGVGGDGTIVYYIMQEGEVKPRQNG
ncbi:uncharacterized protein PV06_09737 [Exophiala oligosperma]|uniref:tRNA-splicing endonuclease subunit Sen15 domain-containing protein n=1 Tax=Exophiala oligosperma TaxID=215243 RepID=A0A0D2ABM9_9EURO|nr:uncharacterized protein PV06_09737 [Exophiala oligosperma]KIW37741.1 hypothetical protein PV06_09737 [Exophiala oligosperma]